MTKRKNSPHTIFRLIFVSLLLMVLPLSGCRTGTGPGEGKLQPVTGPPPRNAEDMVIVDCLLPPQTRKLGSMIYLGPRRPIKATALECEIRGGEYVSYDRSNYKTALNVWLEKANEGDPMAQTYVGEIYARGLGTPPRFEQAAEWYRKAADQGSPRAQYNLGYLYEMGLGVPKDPRKALTWYRKASGLDESIELDLSGREREELKALRQEVERWKKESESLRKQLEESQKEGEKNRAELKRRQSAMEKERAALKRTRLELANLKKGMPVSKQQELARILATIETQKNRLGREREESLKLRNEIARLEEEKKKAGKATSDEMKEVETTIAQYESKLAAQRREADGLAKEIARLQHEKMQAAGPGYVNLETLEKELIRREARLESQRKEAMRLERQIVQLDANTKSYHRKLEKIQEEMKELPGPDIKVLEPLPLATRGTKILNVRSGAPRTRLIGKVTAVAGIYSFSINDKEEKLDPGGMFQFWMPLSPGQTPRVKIVAIDTQGKRADEVYKIVGQKVAAPGIPEKKERKAYDFGAYHALIIGNNTYAKLPKLETAVNDARKVAELLKNKYGFKTELLTNATRYDIYRALDTYRQTLTENDNLLIYYAGHGELDKKNRRGYWLPVDAEPDSAINSIPNYTVTDILNNMAAKQIIIIADTCYSGILTRSAVPGPQGIIAGKKRLKWFKKLTRERSRTVLSSGGLKPVLDTGIGNHSVFAKALLDTLNDNDEVLEASRLHRKVRALVSVSSERLGLKQVPLYAANLNAGHKSGDFLFVPAQ